MKYLFVVAHPDDEILGAGGMIYSLIKKGNEVYICFMCSKAEARSNIKGETSIRDQAVKSLSVMGVEEKYLIFGDFPNIKMNTVDHLEMVKFIENAIRLSKPDIVITHYNNDLNDDHKITSECCDEAIRLFQRNGKDKEIKKYMYMEVLSSTDWATKEAFSPNYYYEINKAGIEKKVEALSKYEGALREYPHPRSKETINALATYRGSQAKLNYAEAFVIVFERDKNAWFKNYRNRSRINRWIKYS